MPALRIRRAQVGPHTQGGKYSRRDYLSTSRRLGYGRGVWPQTSDRYGLVSSIQVSGARRQAFSVQHDARFGGIPTVMDYSGSAHVVETAKDAIVVTRAAAVSGDGSEIVYVNQTITELGGYRAEQVIGHARRSL